MQPVSPLELAARAGYLDAARGWPLDDCPPFRFPELTTAWGEGWRRQKSDIDAVRRSTAGRGNVNPETPGSTPAALPGQTRV